MDDLEVIRFLAMDIITKTAYHAFLEKKLLFSGRLPISAASAASRSFLGGLHSQCFLPCQKSSDVIFVAGSTAKAILVRTSGFLTASAKQCHPQRASLRL